MWHSLLSFRRNKRRLQTLYLIPKPKKKKCCLESLNKLCRKCSISRQNPSTKISECRPIIKVRLIGVDWFLIAVKKSSQHSMWTTLIEIVIMIGLGLFQLFYIKRVLDNKRMIWKLVKHFILNHLTNYSDRFYSRCLSLIPLFWEAMGKELYLKIGEIVLGENCDCTLLRILSKWLYLTPAECFIIGFWT